MLRAVILSITASKSVVVKKLSLQNIGMSIKLLYTVYFPDEEEEELTNENISLTAPTNVSASRNNVATFFLMVTNPIKKVFFSATGLLYF